MKYIEHLNDEVKALLQNRIGCTLVALTAPQVTLDPLYLRKEYIFPWFSLCLANNGKREYLNLSLEKRETESEQEYHRLHITVSETPSCEKGTYCFVPYDTRYPAALMDIGARITDVNSHIHTTINDETGEESEEESTLILHLDNGVCLHIHPQFLGNFVTTGYVVLCVKDEEIRTQICCKPRECLK